MKILKVESCKLCLLDPEQRHQIKCPMWSALYSELKTEIHPDCPLEDYKQCDCEKFQSCEKCSESTYQKAVEEINGIISQVEGQEDCNISEIDRHLAADHDQMLKDIYLITHRDFKKPKTVWKPLSKMKVGVKYWIMDQDNITGTGHLKNNLVLEHDKVPDNFGRAVMCAEIRPPQAPGA